MRVRSGLVMMALAVSALTLAGCAGADAAAAPPTAAPSATTSTTTSTTAPAQTSGGESIAAAPVPNDAAPADVSPVIVTIGDSIMAGYGLDSSDAWPNLLGLDKGVTVTNLGCSGAGFTRSGDCGEDFAGLIPQAAAQHPTLVIIESSDNDSSASVSDIDQSTSSTVTALRAAVPGATIVGLSTLWDQPAAPPATIAAATAALQQAVQTAGGVFIDIGQPIASQAGLLQDDDEHPTTAGQQVLLLAIEDALRQHGIAL